MGDMEADEIGKEEEEEHLNSFTHPPSLPPFLPLPPQARDPGH